VGVRSPSPAATGATPAEVVDLKAIGGKTVRVTGAAHMRLLLVTCRVTGEAGEQTDAPVRFIIEAEPAVPALPAPAKAL
jgi:hypothetical protein